MQWNVKRLSYGILSHEPTRAFPKSYGHSRSAFHGTPRWSGWIWACCCQARWMWPHDWILEDCVVGKVLWNESMLGREQACGLGRKKGVKKKQAKKKKATSCCKHRCLWLCVTVLAKVHCRWCDPVKMVGTCCAKWQVVESRCKLYLTDTDTDTYTYTHRATMHRNCCTWVARTRVV